MVGSFRIFFNMFPMCNQSDLTGPRYFQGKSKENQNFSGNLKKNLFFGSVTEKEIL